VTADLPAVTRAYGFSAPAYIEAFGSADLAAAEDRELIGAWSRAISGPVLDAGCGPGHWSAFLHARGLDVQGVDATPEFIAHASRTYPEIEFRLGDLRELAPAAASLGGVLAWYSLIHAEPEEATEVLQQLARALRPGGGLLVGFFSGDRLEPFDHRVVTGWTWPMSTMTAVIAAAGLLVSSATERIAPNGRRNAAVAARRPV
jgi:trans-aconitate methyltransferase